MKATRLLIVVILFTACIGSQEKDDRKDRLSDQDNDGYTSVEYGGEDCDDDNKNVHPGATETAYDGLDNDCSADTPDDDLDGDLYVLAVDCDDTNPEINPGVKEICDEIDNNCDGENNENGAEDEQQWFADLDADGYGDPATAIMACDPPPNYTDNDRDCDDGEPTANPDGIETCETPFDDNCDGESNPENALECTPFFEDADGDGYGPNASVSSCLCEASGDFTAAETGDCDDSDGAISPSAMEILDDAIDTDCDGGVDSFDFQLIDNRASIQAKGPRLRADADGIFMAWIAEEYNPGSKVEHDGNLLVEFDSLDPSSGEFDFFSAGYASDSVILSDQFDFVMDGDYWVMSHGGLSGTSRSLQVDVIDRTTRSQQSNSSSHAPAQDWDDIQMSLSKTGEVFALACNSDSGETGGLATLQGTIASFWSQSIGVSSVFDNKVKFDRCEHEGLRKSIYASNGSSGKAQMGTESGQTGAYDYENWDLPGINTAISDIESAYKDSLYGVAVAYSGAGKNGLGVEVGNSQDTLILASLVEDLDLALSPTAGVLVCTVNTGGNVDIHYGYLQNGETLTTARIDLGVTGDACAIVSNDNGVLAVAVRSNNDFYIGFAEYP
jgi:hypothetical protein